MNIAHPGAGRMVGYRHPGPEQRAAMMAMREKPERQMRITGSRPKSIGLGAALLAGCSGQAIDRFESSEAVGDPFTRRLAAEYRQTVAFEAGEMYDWGDAAYFARKGTQVAAGELLPPEAVEDWEIPNSLVEEMSVAHGRLAKVLDDGARDVDPDAAAVAQAKFDCWLEQQEENHQPDHIAACRDGFLAALTEIEGQLAPAATTDIPVHLVFFDHDSTEITLAGESVLETLIDAAKAGGTPEITVVGHADRSGGESYNMDLSLQRAEAIKAMLEASGITGSRIVVEASGEASPAIATPDGVREPSNRRAEIRLR